MVLANYHTHSRWCDGQAEIATVVQAALDAGLTQVGISSHAPVPFVPNYPLNYALPLADLASYRAEVLRVREEYRGRIDVLLGLELDALPALRDFNRDEVLALGFDFAIGSVHYVNVDDAGDPWPLDRSAACFDDLVRQRYGGDARRLVGDYYALCASLADYPGVAIVGHLDRGAKLWNAGERYFREDAPWYRAAIDDTLRAYAASGTIVELSTGGWRKGLADPFPSPWIVRRCRELGVRMTLCSDSHRPDQIAYRYADGLALLREAGFETIAAFDPSGQCWVDAPLPHRV